MIFQGFMNFLSNQTDTDIGKIGSFWLCWSLKRFAGYFTFLFEQESSAFKEVPVVIMSSENILPRIDRYALFDYLFMFSIALFSNFENWIFTNMSFDRTQNKISWIHPQSGLFLLSYLDYYDALDMLKD